MVGGEAACRMYIDFSKNSNRYTSLLDSLHIRESIEFTYRRLSGISATTADQTAVVFLDSAGGGTFLQVSLSRIDN